MMMRTLLFIGLSLGWWLSSLQTVLGDVSLGNSIIRENGHTESSSQFTHGLYIEPNELFPASYLPVVHGKTGVYISVGSFRGLNTGALGDYSHIVIFDIDQGTTAFNRYNIELIKTAKNRLEYLSFLYGFKIDEANLLMYRTDESSWGYSGTSDPHPLPENLKHFAESSGLKNIQVPVIKSRSEMPDSQWKNTIFGSDQLFNKIKKMAGDGKIIPITGNLTGDGAIKDLAVALNTEKLYVSTIDISNVIDYTNASPKLFANLAALPHSSDTHLLFTTRTINNAVARDINHWDYSKKIKMDWGYYAYNLDEAQRAVNESLSKNPAIVRINNFLTALFDKKGAAQLSDGLIVSKADPILQGFPMNTFCLMHRLKMISD